MDSSGVPARSARASDRSGVGAGVLALTALGALLRFATLGQQSYWYDEAVTVSIVEGSLADVFRGVVDTESTPPLFYVLAWGWGQVFGTDESQLRALSALVGTLVIPIAFAAGRVVATARIGLAAAALAALSPMLVWYSQEARAYALLTLTGGASFVLFALARREPSPRRLAWWAVVSALAIATHYFAGFVVIAEAALLIHRHRHSTAVRWAVAGVAGAAACLLPLAAVQAGHRRLGWVGGIELTDRITEGVQRLVAAGQPSSWWGATGAEVTPYAWIGAVAILALAAVLLTRRASAEERSGGVLALAVVAVGGGLPAAIALAAHLVSGGDGDYFLDRNVLGAWVPLAVLVGSGLAARRAGIAGAAGLTAILVWSAAVYVDITTSPELQRDDWRAVADALPADDGTLVVVYPAYQSAALVRQRPDLVEMRDTTPVDRVALVLVGFAEAPASFRVPDGFTQTGVEEIQHFVVLEHERERAIETAPGAVARGPLAESDLAVLARAGGS
jgi:4-amino-4-deoxy-L-arabinose transferase-like glycosyltransferase